MSVYARVTYLKISYNTATQTIQIDAQTKYIMALKKLKGWHILNNDIKPTIIIPIEAIVTKTSVEMPVNIW